MNFVLYHLKCLVDLFVHFNLLQFRTFIFAVPPEPLKSLRKPFGRGDVGACGPSEDVYSKKAPRVLRPLRRKTILLYIMFLNSQHVFDICTHLNALRACRVCWCVVRTRASYTRILKFNAQRLNVTKEEYTANASIGLKCVLIRRARARSFVCFCVVYT